MDQLRMASMTMNSTRVDVSLAEGLSSWIRSAMNHLKEWAGLGALAVLMILIAFACLWCICRMRFVQQRQAAMMVQALTPIEAGQSPQAWLAALKA